MDIIAAHNAAHIIVIAGSLTEQQKTFLAEESRRGSAHYTCVAFNYYEDEDQTIVKFYPCESPMKDSRDNDGEKEVKMTAHYGFFDFPEVLTEAADFLNTRAAVLRGFPGVHARVENHTFFITYNNEATEDDRAKAIKWATLQICVSLYDEAVHLKMLDVLGSLDAAFQNFTAAAENCH